jgi:nucleolar protein 56
VQVNYLLFETASGYSLFSVKAIDDVALSADAVQKSISDMARFSKIVSLVAFKPFSTAVDALEQINSVSESDATDMLLTFLKTNLPKVKESKKAKYELGVLDPKLANSISETASTYPCRLNIRLHVSWQNCAVKI